ncbi:MAG: VOC family protein [Caldimonas sp.]
MSGATTAPAIALDHLVVACRSLDAGRAWCEATFGVSAATGGRHALMGTHNLLLSLASPRFPQAYLELIAIDPQAPAPAEPRWFDLDDPALQAAIVEPRLVHWVARTSDIDAAAGALRDVGHDPGRIVGAERMTARGPLRWRITLPAGGRRPAGGALPLLIQWGDAFHPTDSLPPSGVSIAVLEIFGVSAPLAACLRDARVGAGPEPLLARLASPRGEARLAAPFETGPPIEPGRSTPPAVSA